MRSIRLLLPGEEAPKTVQLSPAASLEELISLTRELPSVPSTHTIRFIHAGKFLSDLNGIPEHAIIHVAVTPPQQHITLEIDEIHPEDSPRTDWIVGFSMGVLMGLIMLVLSRDRTIALSSKCRTGVSIGATVYILFGLFLLINDR